LAIHDDVYPLVEKGDEVADGFGFAERLVIRPRNVRGSIGQRQIRRPALVGAVADRLTRLEIDDDVSGGKIEPGRQQSLEQQQRTRRLGQQPAVPLEADVPAAGEDVDAFERVVRVGDDRLVFLMPGEGAEVESEIPGQIRIVRPECRRRTSPAADDDVEHLAGTAMRGKGIRRDQDGQLGKTVDPARRFQLGRDIGLRHRVGRDDPPRLPHQQSVDRVGYRLAVEVNPEVLLGRLVAQRRQCGPEQVSHFGGHPTIMASRGDRRLHPPG
jgi:hypothetical protein